MPDTLVYGPINLRVLSESYPMNTNMIGFRWFSKIHAPLPMDESGHSIGRVNSMLLISWGSEYKIWNVTQ